MIRQNGYYSFDQILYAIIETNGKISIIPKSANAAATAQDIGVNNPPAKIPSIIISDGNLMKSQLKELKIDSETLTKILNHLNINSVKDLIIMSIDSSGKVFYQTYSSKATSVNNIFKEIDQWNCGFPC